MEQKSAYEQHKENLNVLEKLAILITNKVGTMYTAGFFAVLAAISFPAAISSKDTITIIGWITQTFLQLVLLPVILVGQNLENKHTELQSKLDYEADLESIEILKRIETKLDEK